MDDNCHPITMNTRSFEHLDSMDPDPIDRMDHIGPINFNDCTDSIDSTVFIENKND